MKIKREFKGFAKEKKRNNIGSISYNNSTKLLSQWSLSYKRDKFN